MTSSGGGAFSRRLFHYTVGAHIGSILEDRAIVPATAGIDRSVERPVVWCTYSAEWDPTCNKLWQEEETGEVRRLSTRETARLAGGLFRIEVPEDAAPHNWQAFRELSGCPPEIAQALYETAAEAGSDPGLWRVSFEPIPVEHWIDIQTLGDGGWESVLDD